MTPDTTAMPELIYVCDNCGSPTKTEHWTQDKYLSCCPERKPVVCTIARTYPQPDVEAMFYETVNHLDGLQKKPCTPEVVGKIRQAFDHLAATGRLNGVAPEKVEGLDEALSCKGDGSFTEKYGRTPFDVIKEAARRYAALDKIVEDAGKGL